MTAVIALDVGGTSLKAAVVDAEGRRSAQRRLATATDPDRVVRDIVDLTVATAADARAAGLEPVAAGVIVPGQVDPARGVAVYSANLGWRDVPLGDRVRAALDLPVAVDHDVTSGGRAELAFGGHGDIADAIVVQLGTGIAATILSGGSVVRGATGIAGEFGHLPVVPDGELCPCGQLGCLERYSSAAAIARRYEALTGRAATSEQIAGSLGDDPAATQVWAEAVDALALGITAVTMLLDPALVVVSGGFSAAGDTLLTPLRDQLARRIVWRPSPALTRSALGGDVGVAGAALLAWQAAGRSELARWTA